LEKIKVALTELVKRYPEMEEEDLRLLFTKRLDIVSQNWFVAVGYIVGLLIPLVLLGINLSIQPITVTSLYYILVVFGFETVLVLALRSMYQGGTLSRKQEAHLKDYLEARKMVRNRGKP